MCVSQRTDRQFDKRPLYLCPVDLRKLQHALSFDLNARYRALAVVLAVELGWADHAEWIERRLASFDGPPPAQANPPAADAERVSAPPRRRGPSSGVDFFHRLADKFFERLLLIPNFAW